MSNGHGSSCECRSGQRTLAILTRNIATEFPELLMFAGQVGWRFHEDMDLLEIPIGGDEPTNSLFEFVNFLRGLLDASRMNSLRATWLEQGKDVHEQISRIIHAGSLIDMAPHDSGPLLDILLRKRIETWFQPIYRTDNGGLWGYECLLRGRTEDGDLIQPVELIEWARRENLIFMLDRMSRECHLTNAGKKISDLDTTYILINYLPSSIYRPEFCLRSTGAAAKAAGIPASQIVFEVVETELITDMEHLNSVLSYYRRNGYKVALDDIGSGFSSLSVLGDLNPDIVKIDISLIQNARTSTMHADICKSLVGLGHTRGLLVLAEGIETEEDKQFAMSIGADLLQGYLLGRPNPEPVV